MHTYMQSAADRSVAVHHPPAPPLAIQPSQRAAAVRVPCPPHAHAHEAGTGVVVGTHEHGLRARHAACRDLHIKHDIKHYNNTEYMQSVLLKMLYMHSALLFSAFYAKWGQGVHGPSAFDQHVPARVNHHHHRQQQQQQQQQLWFHPHKNPITTQE